MSQQTRLMSAPQFTSFPFSFSEIRIKTISQQHTYPMCRTSRPLIPLRCTRSGTDSTSCLYLEQSQEGGSRLQAPRQLLPSGDAVEAGWDISVNQEDHRSLLCQVTERLWLLSLHLRPLNSSSGETTSTECSTFHFFFSSGNPLRSRRCERFTKKSGLEHLLSLWVLTDGVHRWKDSTAGVPCPIFDCRIGQNLRLVNWDPEDKMGRDSAHVSCCHDGQ